MSKKYIGITVGPIIDTMLLTTTPAGLWGASYMFSYFTRRVIENLISKKYVEEKDFLIPAWNDKNIEIVQKSQGGLLHDRVIFESDREDILERTEEVISDMKEELAEIMYEAIQKYEKERKNKEEIDKNTLIEYMKKYIQTHTMMLEDGKKIILNMGKYLSTLELERSFIEKEEKNYILKFLENKENISEAKSEFKNEILKRSKFIKEDWYFFKDKGKNVLSIDDISESALRHFKDNKDNTKGYFALVQMDGDNLGKVLGKLNSEKIENFSKACFSYADNACNIINSYGGKVIYAGGDDVLFIAPLKGKIEEGSKKEQIDNIFELIHTLTKKFKEEFKGEDYGEVTLSAGVFICYYKYPLYEALKAVFTLLQESKENLKNTITIQFEKHSSTMGRLQIKNEFDKNESIANLLENWLIAIKGRDNKKSMLRSIQKKLYVYRNIIKEGLKEKEKNEVACKLQQIFRNLFEEVEEISNNIDLENVKKFLIYSSKKQDIVKVNSILEQLDTLISLLNFYEMEGN
ncbi:MAG: type III-B CRISPR-associated protein Cas10/Cmr2 [Fusobacterium necrophorum]|nr:type III-B CRISPR-associated protein Cas10/Cmr2 [Fusobacterium necrophorum]